jgi:hypothetical protein
MSPAQVAFGCPGRVAGSKIKRCRAEGGVDRDGHLARAGGSSRAVSHANNIVSGASEAIVRRVGECLGRSDWRSQAVSVCRSTLCADGRARRCSCAEERLRQPARP